MIILYNSYRMCGPRRELNRFFSNKNLVGLFIVYFLIVLVQFSGKENPSLLFRRAWKGNNIKFGTMTSQPTHVSMDEDGHELKNESMGDNSLYTEEEVVIEEYDSTDEIEEIVIEDDHESVDEEIIIEEDHESVDEEIVIEEEIVVEDEHDEIVEEELVDEQKNDEDYEMIVDEVVVEDDGDHLVVDESQDEVVEREQQMVVDEDIVEGTVAVKEDAKVEQQKSPDEEDRKKVERWLDRNADDPENLDELYDACSRLIAVVYKEEILNEEVEPEGMMSRSPLPELYSYLKQHYWYKVHSGELEENAIHNVSASQQTTSTDRGLVFSQEEVTEQRQSKVQEALLNAQARRQVTQEGKHMDEAQQTEEDQKKAEEEIQKKKEEEARLKEEEDARLREEEEARKVEEARQNEAEEARTREEAARKLEEARLREEAEARQQEVEEARKREEARQKEEEEEARLREKEEARKREEARQKEEEEARVREEEARKREEAKKKEEEEARKREEARQNEEEETRKREEAQKEVEEEDVHLEEEEESSTSQTKPFSLEQKLFHAIHDNKIHSPSLKEFKEGYAFSNAVRSFFGKTIMDSSVDVIIDVAGGHGALAALFLITTGAKEAVVIDPAKVGNNNVEDAWKKEFFPDKSLSYRYECLRTGLPAELTRVLKSTSKEKVLVIACHACQHLSEEILDISCRQFGVHAAVMPCCQKDTSPGSSWKSTSKNLSIPIEKVMDILLAGKMMGLSSSTSQPYDVRMKCIDSKITPQNRIILCRKIPSDLKKDGEGTDVDKAHKKLESAYKRAHKPQKSVDSTTDVKPQSDWQVVCLWLTVGFVAGILAHSVISAF